MTHFDDKAKTWDDDPDHVERAKIIAQRLKKALGNRKIKTALEYGSGTGQLSFAMKDDIEHITLMDESEKMTEVALQKCKDLKVDSFNPVQYDLLMNPLPNERFDLIFSLLTLHHIEDIEMIFEKFRELLNPGGVLAIIDLEKEDGSFHDYEFHGHLGFDRTELEKKLYDAELKPMHYEVCYAIEKEMDDGKINEYPLFLLTAENPG